MGQQSKNYNRFNVLIRVILARPFFRRKEDLP
jgi:hypothetical protein